MILGQVFSIYYDLQPSCIGSSYTPNIHKQNHLQCTQSKRVKLQIKLC